MRRILAGKESLSVSLNFITRLLSSLGFALGSSIDSVAQR